MAQANIKVMDYTPQVMGQVEGNTRRALTAMGTEAVALIQDGMDTLCGNPIWDTCNQTVICMRIREKQYENHSEEHCVQIG